MTGSRWKWRTPLVALAIVGSVAAAAPGSAAPPDASPAAHQPRPEIIDPQLRAGVGAAAAAGEPIEYLVSLEAEPALDQIRFDRPAVVAALQQTAERSQRPVVDHLRSQGAEVLNTFWLANLVLVRSSSESMIDVTAIPAVDSIRSVTEVELPDPEVDPLGAAVTQTVEDRTWGIDRIRAHRVWDELGVDGSGTRVAVLDTGVDISHPDLSGKMVTDDPDDPAFPGGWMEFDAAGRPVASNPHDSDAHGTHVSGTIHGGDNFRDGTAIGTAPGAGMMHGLVLPNGSGTTAQVIAGMQWAIDPFDHQGDPAGAPAQVVNMSFGPQNGGINAAFVEPIRNMYHAGVLPVASAGNCGLGCHGSPGNIYESLGIGATDSNDDVATFSGGGLVHAGDFADAPDDWPDSWTVPDVSAPGVEVISSVPPGTFPENPEAIYAVADGTSMAAPHVAGTAAMLLSAEAGLSVPELGGLLIDMSFFDDRYGPERPNDRFGHGRVDAFNAVAQVVLDGGVTGRVTDADGQAVAGVQVAAVEAAAATTTDPQGRYDLRLPPGSYTLRFSGFGYQDTTVSGVEVVADRLTTVDAELEPRPTGTITGTVTLESSGHGVPGVPVQLPGVPVVASTTGADGSYTITDVPVGAYPVAAVPATFPQPAARQVMVEPGGLATADFGLACGEHCRPDERWSASYDGSGTGFFDSDIAGALRVSPDGSTVYVTGGSRGGSTGWDYATIAYDAATGEEIWTARYDGPDGGTDIARELRLSPDGARLFVTGQSAGVGTNGDYATIAYDAATGEQVWTARYDGPRSFVDNPRAMSLSSDGARVFVTGNSFGVDSETDYATVAYDAATGEQAWVTRYDGPGSHIDIAYGLGVSADDADVYVTGQSRSGSTVDTNDYATIAYDAATGEQRWLTRYDGPAGSIDRALELSPDGAHVYVTGESRGVGTGADYATIAYDPATGEQRWAARYNGPGQGGDLPGGLAVSPDGARVFVTGASGGPGTGADYATVAHDAATGEELWAARYNGPASGSDAANALGLSRDGDTLYVTGGGIDEDADYATIAHDAATGRQRWVARHDGFGDTDSASALAVSPDDATVYVTGFTRTGTSLLASDYATLAYDATTGDDLPAFVPWDLRAAPPVGLADRAVQVSVEVANVGTAGGDYEAVLEVDGQPAQSTEVTLESGETTRVSWDVTRQQPGTYQLRVGHLTAQLRVIACAETITGARLGLTVSDGVTCLADGARVVGPVRVHEGAGLVSTAATITGPVTATGADVVQLDATRITGPIRVTGTTGGLVLTGNRVTGVVGLHDNATGDTRIVVSNNVITGRLTCTGNVPAPVDDGEPNPVTGRKSGQCADL